MLKGWKQTEFKTDILTIHWNIRRVWEDAVHLAETGTLFMSWYS